MLIESKVSRSYQQHCGLARALDHLGERWTLLIVRELLLGPRRYGDLLATLDGITTNLLAKRLQEMSAAAIVQKQALAPPASGEAYVLTESGRALEPVIMELGRWGGRFLMDPRKDDRRNIGWGLISMKRRYLGSAPFVLELQAGSRRFEVTLGEERLGVAERAAGRADLRVIAADQEPLFDLLFKGIPAEKLEKKGLLRFEGDASFWPRFLAAFAPMKPPGSAAGSGGKEKAVLGRA